MKKVYLLFFSILFMTSWVNAQDYKLAVGARLGVPLSLSAKYFVSEDAAIEGYVGFRGNEFWNWISISGAYLKHKSLNEVTEGLSWYYGGGASVYFWSYDNGFIGAGSGSTNLGIQLYGGLDYKFKKSPVNISVDWIPTYFVSGYSSGFGAGYGSLGIRYIVK